MDIRRFRRMLRAFEQLTSFQADICCLGVTVAQCHTLLEIEHLGEATIGGLAESLKLDKSTLSRTVDSLVKLGLVERIQDPQDRRYLNTRLTPEGKRTCKLINKENDAFYRRVLESIPTQQREEFLEAIHVFVDAMHKQLTNQDEHK